MVPKLRQRVQAVRRARAGRHCVPAACTGRLATAVVGHMAPAIQQVCGCSTTGKDRRSLCPHSYAGMSRSAPSLVTACACMHGAAHTLAVLLMSMPMCVKHGQRSCARGPCTRGLSCSPALPCHDGSHGVALQRCPASLSPSLTQPQPRRRALSKARQGACFEEHHRARCVVT